MDDDSPGENRFLRSSASLSTIFLLDDYGFEYDCIFGEKHRELERIRAETTVKRDALWEEHVANDPTFFQKESPYLFPILRMGLPHHERKQLWPKFLLSTPQKQIPKRQYRLSNEMAASNSLSEMYAIRDIEQDVGRTFPNHTMFQSEEGKESLRRVLVSFARKVPHIGYCQSLNFVCAMLLLVTEDEDTTLGMLVAIAQDLFPDYYTPTMLGYQVDQRVLEELMEQKLPEVHQHFKTHNVIISTVSIRWFLCLMVNTLSTETLFVFWDNLFFSGSVCVLFAAVLALLKISEKSLLQSATTSDIVGVLHSPVFGLVDPTYLFEVAESMFGSISEEQIEDMRRVHKAEIEREMAEVHRRREVLELQKLTRFTKKELQQLQQEFEQLTQASSCNCITFEGFEDVFTRAIPHWKRGDLFLKRIFDVFDVQRTNYLEFKELMCGFSILCKGTLDEKLKLIFRVYDVNHRGYLELQELTMIFEHVYNKFYTDKVVDTEFVENAFNTMDTDQDGRLSLEEFKQIAVIQPMILECFARPTTKKRGTTATEAKCSGTPRISFHLNPRAKSSPSPSKSVSPTNSVSLLKSNCKNISPSSLPSSSLSQPNPRNNNNNNNSTSNNDSSKGLLEAFGRIEHILWGWILSLFSFFFAFFQSTTTSTTATITASSTPQSPSTPSAVNSEKKKAFSSPSLRESQ
eukprot:TRINITY_DN621_c0_g1_i1.p1 TRINITY_DN621_c0_g1~~TRINITY_DN621_c0_g1_i1.p1  ORF type:complete len:689 (-),score=134.81 TRINITY_DN621_c0_g1_i1:150-2216(-)